MRLTLFSAFTLNQMQGVGITAVSLLSVTIPLFLVFAIHSSANSGGPPSEPRASNKSKRGQVAEAVSRLILPGSILSLLLAPTAVAQPSFVAIKERYFSASYEEALTMLNRMKEGGPPPAADALEIEEYRALCLLALDRRPE